MHPPRILIAGLGNIFLGDDGFGCAAVQRLGQLPIAKAARVVDFGVRARELAYALTECDAAILVDATARGEPPGTLYVLEPSQQVGEAALVDGHSLTAEQVLFTLSAQARPRFVRIVGCEPLTLEPDADDMGLSSVVRAAVEAAVPLIERLVAELLVELTAPAGAVIHA